MGLMSTQFQEVFAANSLSFLRYDPLKNIATSLFYPLNCVRDLGGILRGLYLEIWSRYFDVNWYTGLKALNMDRETSVVSSMKISLINYSGRSFKTHKNALSVHYSHR